MPYEKPGIEITQVQRSQSPILVTPDLEAVVVGNAYWWQDPTWDNPEDALRHSVASTTVSANGSPTTIALSGINPEYYDVSGDESLVIVDLLGISGAETGRVRHLIYGTDYSVTNNVITISGFSVSGGSTYQAKVGFRAARADANVFNKISAVSDIANLIGDPVSWNPLAFGARVCQQNAGTSIAVLGYSGTGTTAAIDAINAHLTLKEVYAIGVLTQKIDPSAAKTHVETMSSPTQKRERFIAINKVVPHTAGIDPELQTISQKDEVVASVRDANAAIQSRRVVSIHPDIAFVLETRHVTTLRPAWIQASFSSFTTFDFSTYGPFARFVSDTKVGGRLYKAGTEITESIWDLLIANGWGGSTGMVTVYAPVPGFYYCAQVAGLAIGTAPEQPLTNYPTTGLSQVYASQDLFSEEQLNVLGEGGTWIMTQDSPSAPIVSRHQMTTDITSVAKRELSITKALDYTAKLMRSTLKPYIGRFNITPDFLKLANSIMVSIGLFLKRTGVINDLKVLSLVQDDLSPDTIRAEIEVLVKYPVNYIKITLVF